MKIQLLVAGKDRDYFEHLTKVLVERYSNTFEVSICTSEEHLMKMTQGKRFDISLIEADMIENVDLSNIRLTMAVWSAEKAYLCQELSIRKINKYQRISSMVSEMLMAFAEVSANVEQTNTNAEITVAWSPVGGSGKTTVSLAYAASAVAAGKKVAYLNLEAFSSIQTYFAANGKSISSVFEKLDSNVEVLLQGIRQQDNGSGIYYFGPPDNYEDVSILSSDDVAKLILGCAKDVDEVVVDLSSTYDEKTQKIMELAKKVLLVVSESKVCESKIKTFRSQNNGFENIVSKTILVANQGSRMRPDGEEKVVRLPMVQSDDPVTVFKTLANGYFEV